MRTISIQCSFCKRAFDRSIAEFNRNERLGRKQYCSLECIGSASAAWAPKNKDKILNFRGKIYRRKPTLLSPFKHFVRHVKVRAFARGKEFSLSSEYLKNLWEEQKGECPYTGWKLFIPESVDKWPSSTPLLRASIDRINSNKGYIEHNVQFTSPMANWAKSDFTELEMINFCKACSEHSFVYCENESSNFPDEMFLRYLSLARRRKREFSISIEDLKTQWSIQNGRCIYSGWRLISPKNTSEWDCMELTPDRASLDRIDSSKGYVPGNIQFVCVMANYAKNKFSSSDLIEFCTAVAKNRKSV